MKVKTSPHNFTFGVEILFIWISFSCFTVWACKKKKRVSENTHMCISLFSHALIKIKGYKLEDVVLVEFLSLSLFVSFSQLNIVHEKLRQTFK